MNAPHQAILPLPNPRQDALRTTWSAHPELHQRYTFQRAMAVRSLAIALRIEAEVKARARN